MPNMPDAPFMISPAGVIVDPNFSTSPQEGLGPNINARNPRAAVQLLPGGSVQLRGTGEFAYTDPSPRGTMQVDITLAAAGTARTIAALVGSVSGITKYLMIAIDSSNRPRVVITNDLAATIAATTPAGAALATGVPLQLRLAWNSAAPVLTGRYASFRINGALIADSEWATDPLAAWTPFVPAAVLVGVGVGGLAVFNGTIAHVQIAKTVTA